MRDEQWRVIFANSEKCKRVSRDIFRQKVLDLKKQLLTSKIENMDEQIKAIMLIQTYKTKEDAVAYVYANELINLFHRSNVIVEALNASKAIDNFDVRAVISVHKEVLHELQVDWADISNGRVKVSQ